MDYLCYCGKPTIMTCEICDNKFYCSKKCKNKDHEQHKLKCKGSSEILVSTKTNKEDDNILWKNAVDAHHYHFMKIKAPKLVFLFQVVLV